eukprot:TRINITY_DN8109_c0_g1_i1.p1 TRINITY_DN8109_c0_g1~~TRINITY_DN8109_c0_g1_i1.p1  ORF type:complete len:342 (+),score=52.07 TRINITY_DN8109_c0_g1_i1:59-1084(+)
MHRRAVSSVRVASRGYSSVCVPLSSRSVVSIEGVDAASHLQGLITNEVLQLQPGAARFGAFLNPKGRLLCMGTALRTEKGFLLDCHAQHAPTLAAHLNRYKLRSKVDVREQPEYSVWSMLGQPSATDLEPYRYSFADPRLPQLGARLITTASCPAPEAQADESVYEVARLAMGMTDHPDDAPAGKGFPLECNLDHLNGVSWHKGCYLGQELTARTFHTGQTRKRVIPVLCHGGAAGNPEQSALLQEVQHTLDPLKDSLQISALLSQLQNRSSPPPGAQIINEATGKKVGVMRTSRWNVGLARVRLDALTPGAKLVVLDDNTEIVPHMSAWLTTALVDGKNK